MLELFVVEHTGDIKAVQAKQISQFSREEEAVSAVILNGIPLGEMPGSLPYEKLISAIKTVYRYDPGMQILIIDVEFSFVFNLIAAEQ